MKILKYFLLVFEIILIEKNGNLTYQIDKIEDLSQERT